MSIKKSIKCKTLFGSIFLAVCRATSVIPAKAGIQSWIPDQVGNDTRCPVACCGKSHRRIVRGQSLIEIIVIVGVVVLLVTGLIVAATSTLRFGQQSKSRSQAVALAREAVEFTREMRNTDWDDLLSRNGTYCLSETKTWSQEPECPMTIQNQFSRTVVFVTSDASTVEVEVTVRWQESSNVRDVKLKTVFTDWKTT